MRRFMQQSIWNWPVSRQRWRCMPRRNTQMRKLCWSRMELSYFKNRQPFPQWIFLKNKFQLPSEKCRNWKYLCTDMEGCWFSMNRRKRQFRNSESRQNRQKNRKRFWRMKNCFWRRSILNSIVMLPGSRIFTIWKDWNVILETAGSIRLMECFWCAEDSLHRQKNISVRQANVWPGGVLIRTTVSHTTIWDWRCFIRTERKRRMMRFTKRHGPMHSRRCLTIIWLRLPVRMANTSRHWNWLSAVWSRTATMSKQEAWKPFYCENWIAWRKQQCGGQKIWSWMPLIMWRCLNRYWQKKIGQKKYGIRHRVKKLSERKIQKRRNGMTEGCVTRLLRYIVRELSCTIV